MLSKLVSPLWRTAEINADDSSSSTSGEHSHQCCGRIRNQAWGPSLHFVKAEIASFRTVNGSVVTRLHLDHGLIDDAVRFTSAEVLGGVLLQPGDLVNYTAVKEDPQGGWKALRVRDAILRHPLTMQTCLSTVVTFNSGGEMCRCLGGWRTSLSRWWEWPHEASHRHCHVVWWKWWLH